MVRSASSGDEHHAATGAEPVPRGRLAEVRLELDAGRTQVLGVGPAHLVVGDGPHEPGGAARARRPRPSCWPPIRPRRSGALPSRPGPPWRSPGRSGSSTPFPGRPGRSCSSVVSSITSSSGEPMATTSRVAAVGNVGGTWHPQRARRENLPAAPRVAFTDAFSSHVSCRVRLGAVPPAPNDRARDLPHRDRAGRGVRHLLGHREDRRPGPRDGRRDRAQRSRAGHQRRGGAHRRRDDGVVQRELQRRARTGDVPAR